MPMRIMTVRLNDGTRRRIEEAQGVLTRKYPGMRVTKANTIRMLIVEGLLRLQLLSVSKPKRIPCRHPHHSKYCGRRCRRPKY